MKKILLSLMCLLAFSTVTLANATADDGLSFKVDNLIKENLLGNAKEIKSISTGLSSAEKISLYNDNFMAAKKCIMPCVVNGTVGLGIGSFIAKDPAGGAIQLTLDLVGYAGVFIGYGLMIKTGLNAGVNSALDSNVDGEAFAKQGLGAVALVYGGAIVLAGSRAFGIARPWIARSKYNKTLMDSLNLSKSQLAVAPIIDPVSNSYGLYASVSF